MAIVVGGIQVDPQGQTLAVNITMPNTGQSVVAYPATTDRTPWPRNSSGSPVSFPATISSPTTFYVTAVGDYTVSATLNGEELAGGFGQTTTVNVNGERVTVTPQIRSFPEEERYQSGTLVPIPALIGGYSEPDEQLLSEVIYNPGAVSTYTISSNPSPPSPIDSAVLRSTFVAPPSGAVRVQLEAYIQVNDASNYEGWTLVDNYSVAVPGAIHSGSGTTNGSPTVTDPAIRSTDNGKAITGPGIPASTFVGTVTPGTSFLLSSSASSQVNVNATATSAAAALSIGTCNSLVLRAPASGASEKRCHYEIEVAGLTPGNSYQWRWAMYSQTNAQTVKMFIGGAQGPAIMRVRAVASRPSQRAVLASKIYELGVPTTVTHNTFFNTYGSIVKCPDGSVLIGYRQGGGDPGAVASYLVTRKAANVAAAIAGTWGNEVQVAGNGTVDYGTCVMTVLSNGHLAMVRWYRPTVGSNVGIVSEVSFSSDNGSTWSAPVTLPQVYSGETVAECQLVEAFGAYWIAVWGYNTGDSNTLCRVTVIKSTDGGATWTTGTEIANGLTDAKFYNETGLRLDAASGKLVAMVRDDTAAPYAFWRTTSTDGGTWTALTSLVTGLQAAPRFLTMDDGRIASLHRMAAPDGGAGMLIQDANSITQSIAPYGLVPLQFNADKMQYGGLIETGANQYLAMFSDALSGTVADIVTVPITVYG